MTLSITIRSVENSDSDCCYAEYRYAEYRYAEYYYADCRYAECHSARWRGIIWNSQPLHLESALLAQVALWADFLFYP